MISSIEGESEMIKRMIVTVFLPVLLITLGYSPIIALVAWVILGGFFILEAAAA